MHEKDSDGFFRMHKISFERMQKTYYVFNNTEYGLISKSRSHFHKKEHCFLLVQGFQWPRNNNKNKLIDTKISGIK